MFAISYWTCNLCVIHSRDDEPDYPYAIRRVLGSKGEIAFNFLSMFLLLLVAIIHFILMANVLYSIIVNFSENPKSFPHPDEIDFTQFSMQWTGIIIAIGCFLLFCLKDISIILKINDKGIYMILTFTLYVIYLGIKALVQEDISFKSSGDSGSDRDGLDITLFNTDLSQIIGVFSLAYMVHNAAVGLMKENKDSSKNSRDLLIAYLIVLVKYCMLGVFGSFAVAGMLKHSKLEKKLKISDIMQFIIEHDNDFFTEVQRDIGIGSLIFIFIQLTTVLPILNFFTRRQFFGLIYGNESEIKPYQFHLFNVVFTLLCLGFEIAVIEPIIVIAYTGAFGGFFLIYILPVVIHLKCLYFGNGKIKTNTINESGNDLTQITHNDEHLIMSVDSNGEVIRPCCREDHTHQKVYNKKFVLVGYSALILFGLFVLGISIYSIVKG
jgi:sodium-coupled neutral amino acid transporter 9